MNLQIELYRDQIEKLPSSGQQIIGQFNQDEMVVYQAFNPSISNDAVRLQKFGGAHYSFNRMSWIKPNFLWMMFRSGWALKENQERILAIKIRIEGFITILSQAVHSSYQPDIYTTRENWQLALKQSQVRLQWDPDHDPFGNKMERRAIQLGLKGGVLRHLSDKWIIEIEDITEFVRAEKTKLGKEGIAHLNVPVERIFDIKDPEIEKSIGIKK